LWTTVLAMLLVVGAYLIGKARAWRNEKPAGSSELLTRFRELHGKGQLSDEEFRTIKSVLSERLEREWMGNGEEG
jgi:uncharacterized membrane protein